MRVIIDPPGWVMEELSARLAHEVEGIARALLPPPPYAQEICRGTLLSREQYLVDIEHLGYRDGRLREPAVRMTAEDVARWTAAIPGRERNSGAGTCDARAEHRRRR